MIPVTVITGKTAWIDPVKIVYVIELEKEKTLINFGSEGSELYVKETVKYVIQFAPELKI